MSTKAVHAYVEPDVRTRFQAYREGCGLPSDAALLSLLVMRELKLRRLGRDDWSAIPSVPTRAKRSRSTKISAILDAALQETFATHVGQLGHSASAAAAALAARELDERWLAIALDWSPQS